MTWINAIRNRLFLKGPPIEVHIWTMEDGGEIPVRKMTNEQLLEAYKTAARKSVINVLHTFVTESINVPSYIVQDYETEYKRWSDWCRILDAEVRKRGAMTAELQHFLDDIEEKSRTALQCDSTTAFATIALIEEA